ncbi:MAG: hypothetical protein WA432_00570 [Candidatus Babeliaceae bacterium]
MKNLKYISLIFIIAYFLSAQEAEQLTPPVITFFIRPEQDLLKNIEPEDLLRKTITLGALDRFILKAKLAPALTQGVYFLYAGMVARSDSNGQVTFPRKNTKETIDIIITRSILPVFLRGTIIHHFVVSEKGQADHYRLTHSSEKPPLWQVEKLPLPMDRRISPLSLIIFAKPENIIIPEVDTITIPGPNLVLPFIYIKPSSMNSVNALTFLKVSKYFKPIKAYYRFTPERYGTIIKP